MNRTLFTLIVVCLLSGTVHAATKQLIGGSNAAGPYWTFGAASSCRATITVDQGSGALPSSRPVQFWPMTGANCGVSGGSSTYRDVSTPGADGILLAPLPVVPNPSPSHVKTFVSYFGQLTAPPSPCPPIGPCTGNWGDKETFEIQTLPITNDFSTTTVTIGGISREAVPLLTLGWFGEELDLIIGGTGQTNAYIASAAFKTSLGEYVPSCGGPNQLCYSQAIQGTNDPTLGATNIRSFLTFAQTTRGFNFPLSYSCADYAIQATRQSHNNWGPTDPEPVLLTKTGSSAGITRNYPNSNAMRAVVYLNIANKAYQISIGAEDYSSNSGGQEFTIYCIDPTVPAPPGAGDGLCNGAENACTTPIDCACTEQGKNAPTACMAGSPGSCCTAGDVKTSNSYGGAPGYCCPVGYYYSNLYAQCLPPPSDGYCDTAAGETPINSPSDCLTGFTCPAGQTWNGAACITPNCDASTVGNSCVGLTTTPGYYCSDGLTADANPNNGYCCPAGQYWNGIICADAEQCELAATCPQVVPPPGERSAAWFTNALCIGSTASYYTGSWGACCSIPGGKFGSAPYFDYTDISGSHTNYNLRTY